MSDSHIKARVGSGSVPPSWLKIDSNCGTTNNSIADMIKITSATTATG